MGERDRLSKDLNPKLMNRSILQASSGELCRMKEEGSMGAYVPRSGVAHCENISELVIYKMSFRLVS